MSITRLVLSCLVVDTCCQIVLWPRSPMNMQPALHKAPDTAWPDQLMDAPPFRRFRNFFSAAAAWSPLVPVTQPSSRHEETRPVTLHSVATISYLSLAKSNKWHLTLHWFHSLFIIWECVCTLYLSIYFLRCRATESFLLKNFHISLRNFKTR